VSPPFGAGLARFPRFAKAAKSGHAAFVAQSARAVASGAGLAQFLRLAKAAKSEHAAAFVAQSARAGGPSGLDWRSSHVSEKLARHAAFADRSVRATLEPP